MNPYLLWREEKQRTLARKHRGGDFELEQFKGSNYEVFNDEKVTLLEHEDTHFFSNFVKQQVADDDASYGMDSQPL